MLTGISFFAALAIISLLLSLLFGGLLLWNARREAARRKQINQNLKSLEELFYQLVDERKPEPKKKGNKIT